MLVSAEVSNLSQDSGKSSNTGGDAPEFGLCYSTMKLQSQHTCILGGNNLSVHSIKATFVLPVIVLLASSSSHFINSK